MNSMAVLSKRVQIFEGKLNISAEINENVLQLAAGLC